MSLRAAVQALVVVSGASLVVSTGAFAQGANGVGPAAAQEATPLPPVEVTTEAAKPKAKSKSAAKKKPKTKGPSSQAAASPTTPSNSAGTQRAETPTSHVDGYVAKTSAAGSKTGAPLIETPQSVSVVTSDQIKDQGAQTLSEALRYTPGVIVELNGASSRYSEARIRGFTPVQYLDGLPLPLNSFFATPRIEPYGLERVEALKGPASFLFGQNSPGGLLNMISKHPTETTLNEVEVQFGSYDRLQTSFDFSGPAGADKKFLYRLTGVFRDAETVVDHTRDDLAYIAPAFTWKPTSDTTFTVLGHYGADYGTFPHQYLPAQGTLYPNPNGRISRSTFLGEPGWDKFDREQWAVGYELDQKIGYGLTFRSNARVTGVDNLFRAHREEGFADADLDTVNRGAYVQATDALSYAADNQLQADFKTGALGHEVLLGVDYYRMSGGWAFDGAWGAPVQPINVYNPVYGAVVPPLTPLAKNDITLEQVGIYAQDQIKLGGWVLTLGGRHDWVENENENLLAGTVSQGSDEAFTGRAGLTYVFSNGVAPYVSYAESFQPVAGVDRFGDSFDPSTGRQYEAGIKYQPPGTNTLITAAVFDILQDNLLTTDPVNPTFQVQTGEVRVRGFDIDAKAKLTSNLEVIAGYAYLDDPPLLFAPRHQASAWAKYTFSDGPFIGLSLGAGVRYKGELYAPLLTPSVTLADALVSYDLKYLSTALTGTEVSVNVTNVFDEYYVEGYCDPTYCSLGSGRVVLGSLKYRW